jgi:predicted DCC family thiol-disulfide oxidoreductase YuxK
VSILYYDGVCALCNGFVRFLLRFDREGHISFAPLQGATAKHTLPPSVVQGLKTMAFRNREGVITFESDAVVASLEELGGRWGVWAGLLSRCPRLIRNGVYRLVSQTRYQLFGKYDVCPLPPPDARARFLP